MSEWSDYFEDFPEENPANYVGGKFDPEGAKRAREIEGNQSEANSEVNEMLANAWKATKDRSFVQVDECPQCGLVELNVYKIKDSLYLCECQDCGIYGQGCSHSEALKITENALGEGLDWRDKPVPWSR
ncbi:hypothetical protein [Microbulbifer sediminum]|uniref:hypothetical protein n=1 Tax=Microbulbifer sediminum TaxID=2904250 RepID=UPI001F3BE12E|nr:hypothetical protein [Microbulbifer sediminum]